MRGPSSLTFSEEFSLFGVDNREHPKELYRKYAGYRCLVVASAACVWDDLARVGVDHVSSEGLFGSWHVLCVNDAIVYFPGVVHHCYSNQHRWLPHWTAARRETICGIPTRKAWGHPGPTHSCRVGGKYNWPWPGHGTSTLNAVYTALALGYDPVVICGAPLDNSPHFFEPPWAHSNFEREVSINESGKMVYWEKSMKAIFRDRVRSMSGRSRDLLGEYTG